MIKLAKTVKIMAIIIFFLILKICIKYLISNVEKRKNLHKRKPFSSFLLFFSNIKN
jgi:Na+-transporting methylmalonyl-CoA/oxaloacetate decarboxylase gamma subunit